MLKFSAVSQIWKKYIQKLNDWDLPLNANTVPTDHDRSFSKSFLGVLWYIFQEFSRTLQ